MQLSRLFFRIALLLSPIALLGTTWLYLYPAFHGCAFPVPPSSHAQPSAPFRLLSLGDPQLEGDSSLPDPDALIFPSVEYLIPHLRDATNITERRRVVTEATQGVVRDAGRWIEGKRKAIDLWGNDLYLAHIVRSIRWWTRPSHISVLGDLLGSQWVTDGEFEKRARRYWGVVMRGLANVPIDLFGVDQTEKETATEEPRDDKAGEEEGGEKLGERGDDEKTGENEDSEKAGENEHNNEDGDSKKKKKKSWRGTTEVLGADRSWEKRVINIAGNHDVGYAGDIDESRLERFERAFGSVNWEIWFTLPEHLRSNSSVDQSTDDSTTLDTTPALRLVILNSMNLDTPAWSEDLQTETYSFMNHVITTSRPVTDKTHATILLTHIPLEKKAGVCVDSPYFDFFEYGQGVREQNMLSDHASKIILEGIFGMSANKDAVGGGIGRRGIVINGHDHEGCDVVHYIRQAGIEDSCEATAFQKREAYWPTITATENELRTAIMEGLGIEDTTFSNLTDTSLASDLPESSPEESAEALAQTPEVDLTPEADSTPQWQARRFPPLPYDINEKNECMTIAKAPTVREITLRSMMGEFSGYAGFLSAWFDPSLGERGEWVFAFSSCGLGIQHWWWSVHIFDLILVVCLLAGGVASVLEGLTPAIKIQHHGQEKEKGLKR